MKDGSQDDPPKGLSWTQARLVRLTQGGPKGAQASAVGMVLAGPIIGGFLIGWWIDQKFGTQFWVLILGLLGVFQRLPRDVYAAKKSAASATRADATTGTRKDR